MVAIRPIKVRGRLDHLLRLLLIFSSSGVKLSLVNADSLEEMLIPRYMILPIVKDWCVSWVAGFHEFTEMGRIVDLDQFMV